MELVVMPVFQEMPVVSVVMAEQPVVVAVAMVLSLVVLFLPVQVVAVVVVLTVPVKLVHQEMQDHQVIVGLQEIQDQEQPQEILVVLLQQTGLERQEMPVL
jgi:hypothetical protein